jgi:hypothetical protein
MTLEIRRQNSMTDTSPTPHTSQASRDVTPAALCVPELLSAIFPFLPPEDLAAAARVSHFWYIPAVDVLWREIDNLEAFNYLTLALDHAAKTSRVRGLDRCYALL